MAAVQLLLLRLALRLLQAGRAPASPQQRYREITAMAAMAPPALPAPANRTWTKRRTKVPTMTAFADDDDVTYFPSSSRATNRRVHHHRSTTTTTRQHTEQMRTNNYNNEDDDDDASPKKLVYTFQQEFAISPNKKKKQQLPRTLGSHVPTMSSNHSYYSESESSLEGLDFIDDWSMQSNNTNQE